MSIKSGHVRWAFDLMNWRCTLNDLELATACIQAEEKERLAKFVYRDDFNASLIGRLLMRRFISVCLPETSYNAIQFERDSRGKPYLNRAIADQADINIDFNVSHHERYAVLAGCFQRKSTENATQQRIGVDVMKTTYSGGKQLSEFFRIMHRTFTPNEWNFIKSRSNERDQTTAFMRHWCLKESYVKNIGVGITINLQSIDFRLSTENLSNASHIRDSSVSVDGKHLPDWIFEESLLDDEHCVAVAINNPVPEYLQHTDTDFRFEIIDFDTLMTNSQPLIDKDTEYCRRIFNKEYKQVL